MTVRKKYDRSVLGRGLDDMGAGRGLDALSLACTCIASTIQWEVK